MFNIYDLSYAAGYVDGDGCFYIGTYQSTNGTIYEYSIQICSVKNDSLKWFKETFGGSIRAKEQSGNRKTPYVWTIKGQQSIDFAEAISPYLVEKHIECRIFIEFGLTIIQNNFAPLEDEGVAHRIALIENMRKTKHEEGLITKKIVESLKLVVGCFYTKQSLAYLAGLIDAEGCFRIKKWNVEGKPNPVSTICLEIGNTKKYFFKYLLSYFGGSITYIEAKAPNRRNSAMWTLSSKKLSYILNGIIQFIKIKKPVCNKIIEYYQTSLPNGGDRHSAEFKKNYAKILNIRDEIINEIHNLNAKGHKLSN